MLVISMHMLKFALHAGTYLRCMLIFALHAGIYDACWYLRCMLVFTMHVDICAACWYLRCMLVFALHAGIYDACMLVFGCMHACIYAASVDLRSYGRYSCAHSLRNSYVIHYGIAKFVPSVMFLSECIVNTYKHAAQISACIVNTSMQRKYQHAS